MNIILHHGAKGRIDTVESISYVLFFLFEKIKSPDCPILSRFFSNFQESFVMVSFIPHCMNEILNAKNGFFEHPALFATLFRSVRVEN